MSDIKNMTVEETEIYAEFLRRRIIDAVKKNGGHLSSNLGAVEIILAMHRVFDAERDKFLFDVGHQAYTHKMLTGRLGDFDRLRQSDGLSGFPSPFESRFDAFVAGHSSTSLSLACGFLRAKKLKGGDYNIIALVGDGAMTGGMVYEALNDLRTIGGKVIIALNDNGCPYGEDGARVSGFADYLNDIKNKKVSKPFEEYGIDYMGVVNGHDVSKLTEAFEEAAQNERSVIVHIVTKKGKGLSAAESDPEGYHGVGRPKGYSIQNAAERDEGVPGDKKRFCDRYERIEEKNFERDFLTEEDCAAVGKEENFDLKNTAEIFRGAEAVKEITRPEEKTFSQIAGETVSALAEVDDRVVVVTAAMKDGTGFSDFAKRFPDRFFDVGICEPHAVTMSAALASQGLIPFVAIYSSFMQRAVDNLLHDVGIMNNNVRFLIDRAGLVPEDGETHQGIFDVGFLRAVPNIAILSPRDGDELAEMIRRTAERVGAVAIRYPKGKAYESKKQLEILKNLSDSYDAESDAAEDFSGGKTPIRAGVFDAENSYGGHCFWIKTAGENAGNFDEKTRSEARDFSTESQLKTLCAGEKKTAKNYNSSEGSKDLSNEKIRNSADENDGEFCAFRTGAFCKNGGGSKVVGSVAEEDFSNEKIENSEPNRYGKNYAFQVNFSKGKADGLGGNASLGFGFSDEKVKSFGRKNGGEFCGGEAVEACRLSGANGKGDALGGGITDEEARSCDEKKDNKICRGADMILGKNAADARAASVKKFSACELKSLSPNSFSVEEKGCACGEHDYNLSQKKRYRTDILGISQREEASARFKNPSTLIGRSADTASGESRLTGEKTVGIPREKNAPRRAETSSALRKKSRITRIFPHVFESPETVRHKEAKAKNDGFKCLLRGESVWENKRFEKVFRPENGAENGLKNDVYKDSPTAKKVVVNGANSHVRPCYFVGENKGFKCVLRGENSSENDSSNGVFPSEKVAENGLNCRIFGERKSNENGIFEERFDSEKPNESDLFEERFNREKPNESDVKNCVCDRDSTAEKPLANVAFGGCFGAKNEALKDVSKVKEAGEKAAYGEPSEEENGSKNRTAENFFGGKNHGKNLGFEGKKDTQKDLDGGDFIEEKAHKRDVFGTKKYGIDRPISWENNEKCPFCGSENYAAKGIYTGGNESEEGQKSRSFIDENRVKNSFCESCKHLKRDDLTTENKPNSRLPAVKRVGETCSVKGKNEAKSGLDGVLGGAEICPRKGEIGAETCPCGAEKTTEICRFGDKNSTQSQALGGEFEAKKGRREGEKGHCDALFLSGKEAKAECVLVVTGAVVYAETLKAAAILAKKHDFSVKIAYQNVIKPLNFCILARLNDSFLCPEKGKHVFVIEDNASAGSFGSAVAEYFSSISDAPIVHVLCVRDAFPGHGTIENMLKKEGLDAESIAERVYNMLYQSRKKID